MRFLLEIFINFFVGVRVLLISVRGNSLGSEGRVFLVGFDGIGVGNIKRGGEEEWFFGW